MTTVYVTHDQVEAMTMGHRVAVLKDGMLQHVDTAKELYRRPANLFVVHVRVRHDDREELLVVRVGGETTIQRGDSVHVGRPDKVHFFDPGGDRLDEVA